MKIKNATQVSVLICFCALLLSVYIATKTTIILSSYPVALKKTKYPIITFSGLIQTKTKYATKDQQQLFKDLDSLLTPIFIIPFIYLAVRFVRSPEIFEEK